MANEEPEEPIHQDHDLVPDARAELMGMAKEGMAHPSTKPVLGGAAIGAAVGFVVPFVGPVLGGAAGAGIALYKRLRP